MYSVINGISVVIPPLWYFTPIYQLVFNTPNFTTAIKLIDQTNLTDTLNKTDGPLTFFVPDDAAFAAVGNLASYSNDEIAQILMGHIFNDNIFYEDLFGKTSGNPVFSRWTVTTKGVNVYLDGGLLFDVDNFAYNGVVNAIDKVLIPSSLGSSAPASSPVAPAPAGTSAPVASSPTSSSNVNTAPTSGAFGGNKPHGILATMMMMMTMASGAAMWLLVSVM